MSIEALNWAFKQPVKGPAKAVLIVLADHVDQDGWCWPSIARLGFRSGFAERAVQMALRQLARDGQILAEIGVGRGRVSRYKVLHNLDAQPEVPPKRQNGEDTNEKVHDMPLSVSTNGAPDAPIAEPVKGAPNSVKGASHAQKGAPHAPEPLRTTTKRTPKGARGRAQPPARCVWDEIQEGLGTRSLCLPQDNRNVRPMLQ